MEPSDSPVHLAETDADADGEDAYGMRYLFNTAEHNP